MKFTVSISSRMSDGRWLWAGDGRLRTNSIEDCAADIGDGVYAALEGAIEYDTTTGHPVPGVYVREVDGREWQVEVKSE